MKDFTIASFKYGIDTRRDALTSQPGTMLSAENLHITPGGELEKRLAFAGRTLMATGVGNWFPYLLPTDVGQTFFGGAPSADVTPAAGLTYQRLVHPAVTEGEAYNPVLHAITGIKARATFDGKALVAATFADGNTFLYYDGTLVNQSRNGLVLTGLADLSDLATQFAAELNRITDWKGLPNVDKDGNVVNGNVIVKSPTDVYFTGIPETETVGGFLGVTPIDRDVAPVAENRAIASFVIVQVGAGSILVEAPIGPGPATPMAWITGIPVNSGANAAATATLVAAAITSNIFYGYTALAEGDTVRVYAPIGFGAQINTGIVRTTTTGGLSTTAVGVTPPTGLAVTFTPNPATLTTNNPYATIKITAGASGGIGPYTYLWAVQGTNNGIMTFASEITHVNCYFKLLLGANVSRGHTYVQAFKCTVTDTASGAAPVVGIVVVSITLT